MPSYNTDFYAYIPAYMKSKLTMKTNLYGNEPWFKEAWEEFRKIALTSPMKDIPDPDRFFEKAELDSMPSVEPSDEKSERYSAQFTEDEISDLFGTNLDENSEAMVEDNGVNFMEDMGDEDSATEINLDIKSASKNSNETLG